MKKQIAGYLYKRRSTKDSSLLSGFLKNYLGIQYDKRYFQLDVEKLTIRYAKDEDKILKDDAFVEEIRNIKAVHPNMVSMPVTRELNGSQVQTTELRSVYDPKAKVDRGPSEGSLAQVYHAFEIETADRNLSLYSADGDIVQLFVFYLKTMLQVKE